MGGYSSTDPSRPPRPRELPDTQRSNPRVLRPVPTKPRQVVKIAILDDYQNVALSIADWSAVAKKADITVFNDHITLSLGGVLITLGYSAGRKTTIDLTDLIWKRARMAG